MPSIARFAAACLTLSISAAPLTAQSPSGLDGAWRHVRTTIVAPDTSFTRQALQGVVVFSGRHFSQIWVDQSGPGVQQASQLTTPEQKAARFDVLIANAGTIEVRDSVLTLRFEHAKMPTVVGRSRTGRFRVSGDTLSVVHDDPWEKDRTKTVRMTLTFVRAH